MLHVAVYLTYLSVMPVMEEHTKAKKKRFGGDFCCVPNCANQRGKDARLGQKRSYYGFPKDGRRKNLWLQNIRRGGGWQPRSWDRVCSDHFVNGKFNIFLLHFAFCIML